MNIRLPGWLTSLFPSSIDPVITAVCSYLAQNPSQASTAIQIINETLQATNQTEQIFTTTINYLNTPANQANLLGGTSTCPSFFSGLKDAIATDLKNANANSADTEHQAMNIVKNALNQLEALFV